jgi:hypothetical protein
MLLREGDPVRWLPLRASQAIQPKIEIQVASTGSRQLQTGSQNQTVVYDILFRAAAETLRVIAADPEHLGAEIGFLGVLHTWGQNLLQNPQT